MAPYHGHHVATLACLRIRRTRRRWRTWLQELSIATAAAARHRSAVGKVKEGATSQAVAQAGATIIVFSVFQSGVKC